FRLEQTYHESRWWRLGVPFVLLNRIGRRACAQEKIYPFLEFAVSGWPLIRRLLRSYCHAPKPIPPRFLGQHIHLPSNLQRPWHPAIAHCVTRRFGIQRDGGQRTTQRTIGCLGCTLERLDQHGHGGLPDTL